MCDREENAHGEGIARTPTARDQLTASGAFERRAEVVMSSASMDVFALRDSVVDEYKKFSTSFTKIHAEDIREQVEKIYSDARYWPEPLIQINASFEQSKNIDALVKEGALEAGCGDIFRVDGAPLTLHEHQRQAISIAADGESYVVTTGTGSGKSLCFFIPIVNAILAEKKRGGARRTRAIIIYPMNALANSQLEEISKFLNNVKGEQPITIARYTGQENDDERRHVAAHPPDILLTNFMMLELLMTRQEEIDRKVIGNCEGLRFLVLDELHTYRGRQGADVALLVRRVRERLSPEKLQCVGTSATMASEGSQKDKNRIVAETASRLFAAKIPDSNVIVETLKRVTDKAKGDADSVRSQLGPAIDAGIAKDVSDGELRKNPLAIWVETRLGIEFSNVDQRWQRARPMTVTEAVERLATESGRSSDACAKALRDLLLVSSLPEEARKGKEPTDASQRGLFAFKLHQFISGARHAYATLEQPGRRVITVEGQQFLPGDDEKRLYAVHFCRTCGHEYHPVKLVSTDAGRRFHARDIDDGPLPKEPDADGDDGEVDDDGEVFGFLTLHARDADFDFNDLEEQYPENWVEETKTGLLRLKASYRKSRPVRYDVEPTGKIGSGNAAWFMPGKFRLCLRCRTTTGGAARDRNRLASLSGEGRSSATTVLVGSVLRWMHAKSELAPEKRKLLAFTDNRQDAALQSGHFNDFLFTSLVRAGFLGALESAGESGLRSDELGVAQQKALGFDRRDREIRGEWLQDPDLRGLHLEDAEGTLRQVLAYRVWFDQRHGWRYTNPNLEQLELVKVTYRGIDELAADDGLFADAPDALRYASAEVRTRVYAVLFDHLRKWMAIKSHVLDQSVIEQLLSRSHARLRAPWGFASDEKPRRSTWLMINVPGRTNRRDDDLIVRGGSRSALGKKLRDSELWGRGDVRTLPAPELDRLIHMLLSAARDHGLVSEEATPFDDAHGFRLSDAAIVFKKATPKFDPKHANDKAFFRDFYSTLARMLRDPAHPLFGFEAREHTAQVESEKRVIREKRFRYGAKEQKELAEDATRLRDMHEAGRFLPVLVCSPTMELGVDISALNAVYLRNVPPTPANYAQRSGRAGRSGQAALVLTYCAAQSPHDQYFFRDPKAMVHGEVRAPLLDLANRDLVESHLHAVWLACTEEPLDPEISKLLVLEDPNRRLRDELRTAMSAPRVAEEAAGRIKRVLAYLEGELTRELAPWFPGIDVFTDNVVRCCLDDFDRAFGRWRGLFIAAEQQRDAARRMMDDYSAAQHEKRAAQTRHAQAIDQLNLLQGSATNTSDFYTYRYLATEGFLPGYNFPRLPLMAYVPATSDNKGRQTFLQRPRFLALAEFGPRSLVYHEGRAYRVVRALLPLERKDGGAPADVQLPTKAVRICKSCGAAHFDDHASTCHGCELPLGDAEHVKNIFRIENVATYPAERITANDEERQRQGFELQTTFEWKGREGSFDVLRGTTSDADGDVIRLAYGPGATITRLNKGLRRRADRTVLGFRIDPLSGYWAKNADEDDGEAGNDPTATPRQWIVPSVQDRKNALLLQPTEEELPTETLATLQHSLLRGIEATFQLEEGEILGEAMPSHDSRKGVLFYEATEGGAGVLTRLVTETDAIARVARKALELMHFTPESISNGSGDGSTLADVAKTECVAACYRCLLSYFNQPDHEILDRRDAKAREILLRLARGATRGLAWRRPSANPPPMPDGLDARTARWIEMLDAAALLRPDVEALVIGSTRIPIVWRAHYVAALVGDASDATRAALDARGFEVIAFADDEAQWTEQFARLGAALGQK